MNTVKDGDSFKLHLKDHVSGSTQPTSCFRHTQSSYLTRGRLTKLASKAINYSLLDSVDCSSIHLSLLLCGTAR